MLRNRRRARRTEQLERYAGRARPAGRSVSPLGGVKRTHAVRAGEVHHAGRDDVVADREHVAGDVRAPPPAASGRRGPRRRPRSGSGARSSPVPEGGRLPPGRDQAIDDLQGVVAAAQATVEDVDGADLGVVVDDRVVVEGLEARSPAASARASARLVVIAVMVGGDDVDTG